MDERWRVNNDEWWCVERKQKCIDMALAAHDHRSMTAWQSILDKAPWCRNLGGMSSGMKLLLLKRMCPTSTNQTSTTPSLHLPSNIHWGLHRGGVIAATGLAEEGHHHADGPLLGGHIQIGLCAAGEGGRCGAALDHRGMA